MVVFIDDTKTKWCYTLNSEKDSNALIKLYTQQDINEGLIIAYTPGYKEGVVGTLHDDGKSRLFFALFKSYIEFYEYYKRAYKTPYFYEVILGKHQQKPKFDIDIKVDDIIALTPNTITNEDIETLTDMFVQTIISSIIHIIVTTSNITEQQIREKIMIFTSHSKIKRSFHIVVDGFYHDSHDNIFPNQEAKSFCEKVCEHIITLPPIYSIECKDLIKFIDKSVYNSTQQFRTFMSCKIDTIRYKVFHDNYNKFRDIPYKFSSNDLTPEIKLLEILQNSLISKINNGCIPLPYYKNNCDTKIRNPFLDALMTDVFVEQCMDRLSLAMPNHPFTLISYEANIIGLRRLRPSWCPCCKITHENNGSILRITNNKIYWDCRRREYHGNNPPLDLGYTDLFYVQPIDTKPIVFKPMDKPPETIVLTYKMKSTEPKQLSHNICDETSYGIFSFGNFDMTPYFPK